MKNTTAILATGFLLLTIALPASAQIVHNNNVIIDGSACVGLDCTSGESFGFDTIRIKENNLRIRAVDTSSTASFPTNDWQITFNDSSNGGASKFSIDDIDGGRTPFTIEAGAPSHSLYVDDAGRIGLGTSTPVVELHVKDGDTPTLRLEQDGSSGFTPQTWDVAGNETNFFIRDVSNGSKLPFRIRPSAPTSSIDVAADGKVGLNTSSPQDELHVRGAENTTDLRLESTFGDGANWRFRANSDTGALVVRNEEGGTSPVLIREGAINNLLIVGNDGVGIGKFPAAGSALDVNGAIYQSGGLLHADYVFEPDYDLESIDEHSDFMWNNKHLPAVPERRVDETGREIISIGDHRRGILEELEKAHIYINQLHQRLGDKEAKLDVLGERLERLEGQLVVSEQ